MKINFEISREKFLLASMILSIFIAVILTINSIETDTDILNSADIGDNIVIYGMGLGYQEGKITDKSGWSVKIENRWFNLGNCWDIVKIEHENKTQ